MLSVIKEHTCFGHVGRERQCFLEVILEEVMFELGFETHRGRPGGGRLGKQGKGLLPEDGRSRAVWAGHMHWLPPALGAMMKNKQAWMEVCLRCG